MALHFLVETLDAPVAGGTVLLTGAEARHAVTVRWVRPGEAVTVGDGRGTLADGVCESASPSEVVVRIHTVRIVDAPTPSLVLVQALAKGDRDELAVQAATELGVSEVIPWAAARSVSRWEGAKAQRGRARWATIAATNTSAAQWWIWRITIPARTSKLMRMADSWVVSTILSMSSRRSLT